MRTSRQTLYRRSIPFAILPTVFFALFYVYVWLRIDPRLVYHKQCPIFILGSGFFNRFLNHPGGLVEYLCALLSQFHTYPWAGALIITSAAGLICLATRTFIARMGGRLNVLYLLPAVPLLMLHNQYDHPLTTSIGLLIALLFLNVYGHIFPGSAVLRLVAFLPLSALLYYAAAGPYLLFVFLCALFELLTKGRLSLCLLYLLFALAGPFVAGTYIFDVDLIDAYAALLPFHPDRELSIASILLYLFFPPVAFIVPLWQRPDTETSSTTDMTAPSVPTSTLEYDPKGLLKWVCVSLALLVLAAGAAFLSFDSDEKRLLQIDYYARHKMWPQVLQEARRLPAQRYDVTTYWDVNRALFHTGRLPYEVFSYPQSPSGLMGTNVPKERQKLTVAAQLNLGEVFLALGRVSEAEWITHEVLVTMGERPSILRRFVLIFLAKEQTYSAPLFLNALAKHLLWRNWAEDLRRRLEEDPLLSQDKELEHIRSVMIEKDRLGQVYIETMMQQLLERNKRNRMAFEYLMADYLLNGEVENVALNIGRLDDFDYPAIPRHYEEAILLHMRAARNKDVDLHGRQISPETRQRFEAFFQIYDRHKANRQAARNVLMADYAGSYLLYNVFGYQATSGP